MMGMDQVARLRSMVETYRTLASESMKEDDSRFFAGVVAGCDSMIEFIDTIRRDVPSEGSATSVAR